MAGLRQLYDTLEVHVRSLLSFSVDSQYYWTLLSSIIIEQIDSFGKANFTTRMKYIRDSVRSFMCPRSEHKISECASTKTCYYCKK